MSSSARTSHGMTSSEPTDEASSRTFPSIRSPWNVKASSAPSAARRRAIAHAIERLLATPRTSARLPSNLPTAASLRQSCQMAGTLRSVRRLAGSIAVLVALTLAATASAAFRPIERRHGEIVIPRVRAGTITVPAAHRRGRITVILTLAQPPLAAYSRRLAGPTLLEPPEHVEPRLQGLCRHAPARAAGRRGNAEAGDSRGDGPAELHDPPQRNGSRAAGDRARAGGQALVRAQALSELPLHAGPRPQPGPDRRGHGGGRERSRWRGNEDRRRRRRRRSDEQVLQPEGLHLSGGLPQGRPEVDDAEGDRRTLLRRASARTTARRWRWTRRPHSTARTSRGSQPGTPARPHPQEPTIRRRRDCQVSHRARKSATTGSSTSRHRWVTWAIRRRSSQPSRPPFGTAWT